MYYTVEHQSRTTTTERAALPPLRLRVGPTEHGMPSLTVWLFPVRLALGSFPRQQACELHSFYFPLLNYGFSSLQWSICLSKTRNEGLALADRSTRYVHWGLAR